LSSAASAPIILAQRWCLSMRKTELFIKVGNHNVQTGAKYASDFTYPVVPSALQRNAL
jgi:hypothetical protein